MNDSIITKRRTGDSSPFVSVVDEKDGLKGVLAGRPDFVEHPITKKHIKIVDIFQEKEETKCPGCNKLNKNVWIRVLANGMIVYECLNCKQFHFCEVVK